MAAYRSAIHRSTGYTPNYLMFAREVNAPLDATVRSPSNEETASDDYVQNLLDKIITRTASSENINKPQPTSKNDIMT